MISGVYNRLAQIGLEQIGHSLFPAYHVSTTGIKYPHLLRCHPLSHTYHRFEGDDASSARFDLWGIEGRALLLERGGVPGAVVGSAVNRRSAL